MTPKDINRVSHEEIIDTKGNHYELKLTVVV